MPVSTECGAALLSFRYPSYTINPYGTVYIQPVIYKSNKKTNLLCIVTTSFNLARFEHENEMQRKALEQ